MLLPRRRRLARASPLPSSDGSISSSRSSTSGRDHSRSLSFDTSASDPWFFEIPVRPVSCSNAALLELERSPSPETRSLASLPDTDDSPPLSRTTSSRAVSLSLKHFRASLPSLSPPPPTAAPERATYLPGQGRRRRFASLPAVADEAQPAPTHGHPHGDAIWWASSPAPAAPRPRARASTVVNDASASPALSTAGWMQVYSPLDLDSPPIIVRRSTSDPLPLPRTHGNTVPGASRRSSELLPPDLMPIFSLASGQPLEAHGYDQHRSATAVASREMIADRTAPAWARRSILDRLQPQDATIERILTEVRPPLPCSRCASSR